MKATATATTRPRKTAAYETLLARLNETRVQQDDPQPADARIISRATPSYAPLDSP